MSIQRKCELAGIVRSSYYRHQNAPEGDSTEEVELRAEIQNICLEMRRYGYRRVTEELRRRARVVNHKRVLSLMHKDNLLCVRKKRWIATTDSAHGFRIYPNILAQTLLTKTDQAWVADITYIRLAKDFIYLAVVLDAYSRRVIGWELSRYLDTDLCLRALQMALETRIVAPGLVHHSDRGVQYASDRYTALLRKNGITISMSRSGNPYDNARAESFMKTLKYEEVLINEYNSLDDARKSICHFLEIVYNQKRLHSSLGYKPPTEFETDYTNSLIQKSSTLNADFTVSF